ncbi:unnamed protein product [Microthlaspi erraticum]|uniref:Uncharacterized protein n=1 Tax=Microthlaspi erraticum TaxID=1685480 RepID=A0A6D2JZE7_9BRAS|nr:unnamed protein product [Microthlaspi erraticum]
MLPMYIFVVVVDEEALQEDDEKDHDVVVSGIVQVREHAVEKETEDDLEIDEGEPVLEESEEENEEYGSSIDENDNKLNPISLPLSLSLGYLSFSISQSSPASSQLRHLLVPSSLVFTIKGPIAEVCLNNRSLFVLKFNEDVHRRQLPVLVVLLLHRLPCQSFHL